MFIKAYSYCTHIAAVASTLEYTLYNSEFNI